MNKYYTEIREEIETLGFNVINFDFDRPWGGFLLIDESQSQDFINTFISKENLEIEGRLSPKILIVNPNSRLSWQFHYRRKEIWRVYKNSVGIIRSMDDNQNEMEILNQGDTIKFKTEERHRLVGLSNFGVVAEIWIHTNFKNPSDEQDIVRLQDDYSRN